MNNWVIWAFTAATWLAVVMLLLWIVNKLIAPWQRRRQLAQQPFLGLLELGFTLPQTSASWHKTDVLGTEIALIGDIDGYTVEVSSNYTVGWSKFPYYLIRVFFSSEDLSIRELQNRRLKNIRESEFIRWNENMTLNFSCLETKGMLGKYSPTSGVPVFTVAKRIIVELQALGLKPISYVGAKIQWQKIQE